MPLKGQYRQSARRLDRATTALRLAPYALVLVADCGRQRPPHAPPRPYALCLMSYALCLASYALFLVADCGLQRPPHAPPRPHALCHMPYALCLAPYDLFLVADCGRQRPPHAPPRACLLAACWLQEFVGCRKLLACRLPLESA